MSDAPFRTLAGPGEAELRVRGSIFHARAVPAEAEADARASLAERERTMWECSHHCAAWRMRSGLFRTVDAGEPSVSAGVPILAALDGAELLDCVIIVSRHFGGTKLGMGGLVRAYGEAAATALQAAPIRVGAPAVRLRIRYAYERTAAVMRVLERTGAEEIQHGFTGGGAEGTAEISLAANRESALREHLRNETAGGPEPETLGLRVLYRNASPDARY